jgi:hypothetical protein
MSHKDVPVTMKCMDCSNITLDDRTSMASATSGTELLSRCVSVLPMFPHVTLDWPETDSSFLLLTAGAVVSSLAEATPAKQT